MMQTQIPSGLQALMQASQVLSTQASPTAPGPQGPQPTVAERVNQQIKQAAQPPQGIAGLSPNMRDVGQQAGIAGQIMAQKAAQQQQTAQNPEAIAQMAAQMLQGKGVAGLPAEMGFKEGGIIGYDGEEGSKVDLNEARQRLVAAAKSGDQEAAAFYAKQVADAQAEAAKQQEKAEFQKFLTTPTRPAFAPESAPVSPAYPDETRRGAAASTGIAQLAPPAAQAAPRPAAPPAAPRPAAPRAPAPALATIDTSGIAKPTMESLVEGAEKIVPPTAEKAIEDLKGIEAERAKLKAGMADLSAEGIAALEQEKASRKQLLASKAERDQFNRVRAFFNDLATRGSSYDTVQQGIFAREEAERLADLANSKAIIELKKAQQADKLGDVDRKSDAIKQYNDLRNKESQYRTQAAQVAGTLQSNVYQTDVGVLKTQAEIQQRDREAKERFGLERQRLALAETQGADNKLISQANVAMGKLTDAWKQYEKVKESNKMGLMLGEKDLKDPQAQKMHSDAIAAVNDAYKNLVLPAQTMYNNLAGKVLGTPPAPAGGGSDIAAAAAAELARRQQKQ